MHVQVIKMNGDLCNALTLQCVSCTTRTVQRELHRCRLESADLDESADSVNVAEEAAQPLGHGLCCNICRQQAPTVGES